MRHWYQLEIRMEIQINNRMEWNMKCNYVYWPVTHLVCWWLAGLAISMYLYAHWLSVHFWSLLSQNSKGACCLLRIKRPPPPGQKTRSRQIKANRFRMAFEYRQPGWLAIGWLYRESGRPRMRWRRARFVNYFYGHFLFWCSHCETLRMMAHPSHH